MRRLKRNQREFQYCLYTGKTEKIGADGYKTGHTIESYEDPVTAKGCVVFRGSSNVRPYGVDEDFSVQIIPDNPIDDITTTTKIIIDDVEYFVTSAPRTMNEQKIYAK